MDSPYSKSIDLSKSARDNDRLWSAISSDNEWQQVVQQETTSDKKWQRVVISANFPFFWIKEELNHHAL